MVGHGTLDLGRIFVFSQTFLSDLTKQVVVCPCQIFDLDDELGPNPVDAAKDERRTKPVRTRWSAIERHPGSGERLQPPPKPLELRVVNSGSDASGINEPTVWIIVRQEQSPEPGMRAFGIGPADHEGKSEPQQFCGFHEPGEVPTGLDNGLILDSLSRAASAPAAYLK